MHNILSMLVANTAWSRPNNQDLETPTSVYSCDIGTSSNVVVMHWKARGRWVGAWGMHNILSMLVANTVWSPPNNQDLEIPSFEYSCRISTSSTVVVLPWKAKGRVWGGGGGAWGVHNILSMLVANTAWFVTKLSRVLNTLICVYYY